MPKPDILDHLRGAFEELRADAAVDVGELAQFTSLQAQKLVPLKDDPKFCEAFEAARLSVLRKAAEAGVKPAAKSGGKAADKTDDPKWTITVPLLLRFAIFAHS